MLNSKSWLSIVIFFVVVLLALLVSAVIVVYGVESFGSDFRNVLEDSFKYLFLWRLFLYALVTGLWLRVLKPSLLQQAAKKRQVMVDRLKIRERWVMIFILVYEITALYSAFSPGVEN